MKRIGFIGVGTMGLPMAKNLVKKGFAVTAYDTIAEAVQAAASAGMTAAGSTAEAVATADLVITMLPSSPHAESVYTGDGGVLAAARKGTLCVDMSTIDPSVSRRIAAGATERGVRFMDAPVSGGVPRAAEGTLVPSELPDQAGAVDEQFDPFEAPGFAVAPQIFHDAGLYIFRGCGPEGAVYSGGCALRPIAKG